MVTSNANAAELLRQMQSNPNMFFMFDPESHYINSRAIYRAIKTLLEKKYYGNMNKT